MTLTENIRTWVKENKAILGYRRSIRYLKMHKPKMIIIAKNIPESLRKEIEHNAKISKVTIEVFDGSSKELGIICGKPFPISTIAVKD
jgi:large subunit ribosomal protein L30e